MSAEHRSLMLALRAERYSSAEWRAMVGVADPDDLRAIIKECCLSATSTCCNRTRIGLLATELVERASRAFRREMEAVERATKAEKQLENIQLAASAAGAATPPAQPAEKGKGKR